MKTTTTRIGHWNVTTISQQQAAAIRRNTGCSWPEGGEEIATGDGRMLGREFGQYYLKEVAR